MMVRNGYHPSPDSLLAGYFWPIVWHYLSDTSTGYQIWQGYNVELGYRYSVNLPRHLDKIQLYRLLVHLVSVLIKKSC